MSQAADVIALIEKLTSEVARLGRDVLILRDRIIPHDDERLPPVWSPPPIKTDKDLLERIADTREQIHNCEYHLSAIRGGMDAIVSDAISREEMKPYLKHR